MSQANGLWAGQGGRSSREDGQQDQEQEVGQPAAGLSAPLLLLLERAQAYAEAARAEGGADARGAAALAAFAAQVWMDSSTEAEPEAAPGAGGAGAVTIGTIHIAKGLEWPVVVLPLVSEGLLPTAHRPDRLACEDLCEQGWAEARRAHLEEERWVGPCFLHLIYLAWSGLVWPSLD